MAYKILPAEVLKVIFSSLLLVEPEKTNLSYCQLVYKTWNPPAKKVQFYSITIKDEEHAERVINTLKGRKDKPGQYTRVINYLVPAVEVDETGKLTFTNQKDHNKLIPALSAIFPFIKQIKWGYYHKLYYNALMIDKVVSNWIYLEYISAPDRVTKLTGRQYIECALKYRNGITTLYAFGKFATQLPQHAGSFPVLTNAHISCYFNNLDSNLKLPVDNSKSVIRTICCELDPFPYYRSLQVEPVEQYDTTTVEAFTDIEHLNIKILLFSNDNTMQYIMEKFPNLKPLRVNGDRYTIMQEGGIVRTMITSQFSLSTQVFGNFLTYVFDLNCYYVNHIYTSPGRVIGVLSAYWELCEEDTDKPLVLNYGEIEDSDLSFGDEETVKIEMESGRCSFGKGGDKIPIVIYSNLGATALPHVRVIEKIGYQINKLSLGLSKGRKLCNLKEQKYIDMLTVLFFEHISTHCTSLVDLIITDAKF